MSITISELANVKIVYFPPDLTSRLQMSDQGMISVFIFFSTMSQDRAFYALILINREILQAMRVVAVSWCDEAATIISDCFENMFLNVYLYFLYA